MSETVEPQALTSPAHPKAVFLMLKQAFRNYVLTGGAVNVSISTIPTFVHTAAQAVSGTVTKSAGVPMPVSVSVAVKQGTTTVTTLTGAINATTGAWTVTIPANALTANTYTATATTSAPVATATSNSFVVT